jgi:hypothetical protein
MGQSRAYAEKDTFIVDSTLTANNGLNPVLETWSKYNEDKGIKEWSRILIKFALSSFTDQILNKGTLPDPRIDSSVSAFINMTNVYHGETKASNFDIWALPLTAFWSEGRGLDSDNFTNRDFADALSATNSTPWDANGGTSGGHAVIGAHDLGWDSNSGSQYFSHGEENLKIDITPFFKEVLNGSSSDYGFMIRMSDGVEAKSEADATAAGYDLSTVSSSWYTKKFYGRETNTTNRPFASLEWDSSVKDDRSYITFSKTGSLFYYNFENGQLVDIDGFRKFPGYVDLSANGISITENGLTASRFSKGVYKLEIGTAQDDLGNALTGVNIGLSSSTSFIDSWTVTAADIVSKRDFSFNMKLPNFESTYSYDISRYPIKLINLRNHYEGGSKSYIKMYIKDTSAKLKALTGTTTLMNNFICTDGTFEIREKTTDKIETGPFDLSYGEDGNYFYLDTNNLYRGVEYKVVVKINVRGETFWYDYPDTWSFTVN